MKRFLALIAALALAGPALWAGPAAAQNSPLTGLAPRGTVQSTDLIPIMPAGGTQLMQTTVGAIISPASAGATGTVQTATVTAPNYSCATSGAGTTTLSIACTLANQNANTVFAGPASGSPGVPTWRALTSADLPAFGCAALPALTGDITTPGASCATTLANDGVTAGSYSTPSSITVDAKGRVTAISGSACVSGCGVPLLSSFTWVDQNTATATQPATGAAIQMSIPGNTAQGFRHILAVNVPATPWKIVGLLRSSTPASIDTAAAGIYLYDGTKVIAWESWIQTAGFKTVLTNMSTVSTTASTPFTGSQGWGMNNSYTQFFYFQIRDDGTNLYFDLSLDGVNFFNQATEAVGSFMTPTKVGWGGTEAQNQTTPMFVSLTSWVFYTNTNLSGP